MGLVVLSVEGLRGRLESNEGFSWDALDSPRSLESVGWGRALRLLATEGARVCEGVTEMLGVVGREVGKGMWWGGLESGFRGVSRTGLVGIGRGSVGTGFIGGIEVEAGPGLDELFFRELTDKARDLLADTSACREATEGAGDGVFGGGDVESSERTEVEDISWTRWARRFDNEGPLVEGRGG